LQGQYRFTISHIDIVLFLFFDVNKKEDENIVKVNLMRYVQILNLYVDIWIE